MFVTLDALGEMYASKLSYLPVPHREPHMRQYLKTLAARKPVVFTGDLNCGFEDLDIHNPTAKHIVKQSGLTPLERAAFAEMLNETRYRDAFRHFHPSKCVFCAARVT